MEVSSTSEDEDEVTLDDDLTFSTVSEKTKVSTELSKFIVVAIASIQ